MTEVEKLDAIKALCEQMGTQQDEYAVGLAADILAIIEDGVGVTSELIWQSIFSIKPRTVGEALHLVID